MVSAIAADTVSPREREFACKRIHDLLAVHSLERPTDVAAVDAAIRLTYGELSEAVDALSKALMAAGIGPGDRVATLTPPAHEFWTTYLATVSVGAIWLGLNPRYQEPEYRYLIEDARPRLIFAREEYDERRYCDEIQAIATDETIIVALGKPSGRAMAMDEFLATGTAVADNDLASRRAAVAVEDVAVIVYTSGTTGRPKGAMLSHRAIMTAALVNLSWMGDGLESTLCAAPINHVGALNNVCMNVLAYGGRIVFHHRVDLIEIAEITAREQLAYLVASPTSFAMMAASPEAGLKRLAHYRLIVFGGGSTAEALLKPVHALGIPMATVYGQTETCGIVTASAFDAPLSVMAETIGRPLPGAEIRIADAAGAAKPAGQTGEIQIRGAYCMTGYFERPEATAEAFTADGFLRTGDLGIERPDGNFAFVGRLKEMYKSGGYNIYPVEIELALAEHPAVSLAAVLPKPHETFQEVGHAFVASSDPALDGETLKAFLKSRLANYKIPKSFSISASLPLLPNSKIDKQQLKRRLERNEI